MSSLSPQNLMLLGVFDNLQSLSQPNDAVSPEITQNYEELLNAFLSNEISRPALIEITRSIGRDDVAERIEATPVTDSVWNNTAGFLTDNILNGDGSQLTSDFSARPEFPTLSADQLQAFSHAVSNLETQDPDLATHIKADPRFVDFMNQHASANWYSDAEVSATIEQIYQVHTEAVTTLDNMPYDGIQMALAGSAQDLFNLVQDNNLDLIGEELTAAPERTYFSGLEVDAPLTQEELQSVTAPILAEDRAARFSEETTTEQEQVPEQPAEQAPESQIAESTPTENETITASDVDVDVAPEDVIHNVTQGDNLWNVARAYAEEHFDDVSGGNVMTAMKNIAHFNPELPTVNPDGTLNYDVTYNLAEGDNAHSLFPGQPLRMPPPDQLLEPIPEAQNLDHVALDARVGHGPNITLNETSTPEAAPAAEAPITPDQIWNRLDLVEVEIPSISATGDHLNDPSYFPGADSTGPTRFASMQTSFGIATDGVEITHGRTPEWAQTPDNSNLQLSAPMVG